MNDLHDYAQSSHFILPHEEASVFHTFQNAHNLVNCVKGYAPMDLHLNAHWDTGHY